MTAWPREREGAATAIFVVLVALGVVAVVVWVARTSSELPDGPDDVVWDREACAQCRMHVGEPAFAAQVQTTDGRVLSYDDPGCLFLHVAREAPPVHAIWLHHLEEDRWLRREEAGFIETSPTPMGFGLGAVEAARAGAISFNEAAARVTSSRREGR